MANQKRKTINAAKGVDLPKLRYVDDYIRLLNTMQSEVRDIEQLVKQQQKLLSHLTASTNRIRIPTHLKAGFTFNVTPTDKKEQLKQLKRLKTTIDPKLTKVVVPNISKLKSQYALAEDLYEKHRTLESMETNLALQFPDRRGDAYKAAIDGIQALKVKVADQLKQVLGFLNEVASKHVPAEFAEYMEMVAQSVQEHVIYKDSDLFLYVSVTDDGSLMFTYYLMLVDAINDEAEITPHLYISIQWKLGKDSSVKVQLNHEYEVPNKLMLSGGTEVSSVSEAVKAIATLLELEDFSTSLGVVPLALQLRVDPSKLTPELFSYRDFISAVTVDENSLKFTLRKEANTPELVKTVGYQLYKEIKELVKGRSTKLKMRLEKQKNTSVITFNISAIAGKTEFSTYDAEFLRDKFDLSDAAMRKIVNVINSDNYRKE